ncbi:Transmembrane [Heracleum sosnowskyi]|uniref:Transmembrane n=1 Tax=Heracleum sosnowskyi TaxID=360622 RepID=A0AAD8IQE0_9APIA|nr:Transmembrane [Heracleum sosnowskyi]
MEDLNMIAADCIVISCCCQCLVLQIVVFILLKLPHKLIRKTIKYVKKLRNQKKNANAITRQLSGYSIDGVIRSQSGSLRIKFEGLMSEECCGNCMDEIDKALEDMSRNGEFAFGSFWKGENLEENIPTLAVQNLQLHKLQYNLVTYKHSNIVCSYFRCYY